MRIAFDYLGRTYEITTERAESSYGVPVLLVDGEVQDGYVRNLEIEEDEG